MNKYLTGGGVLVGILLVAFFLFHSSSKVAEAPVVAAEQTAPTISVDSGTVFITKDGNERTVTTGERVLPPYELRSDASGKATIRFDDGSELRLDMDSKLEVAAASYSPESKNLLVNVTLTIGRVWSDIVSLATPESAWEVETSNVVATVRGTAFGVAVTPGATTTVFGSENSVRLTPKDPETGERDTERETILNEDEYVVIDDEIAGDDSGKKPEVKKQSDTEQNDPWIQGNEKRDKEHEEVEDETSDDDDRKDAENEADNEIEDERESEDDDIPTPEPNAPQTTPPAPAPKPSPSIEKAKAQSLTITPSQTLNGIVEDTRVTLTATLTYSDGSTRDVSKEVAWKVVGQIGKMEGNVFVPLLDPSIAEYGKGPGSITATWTDTTTGTGLLGSTGIFEVKAKVIILDQRG